AAAPGGAAATRPRGRSRAADRIAGRRQAAAAQAARSLGGPAPLDPGGSRAGARLPQAARHQAAGARGRKARGRVIVGQSNVGKLKTAFQNKCSTTNSTPRPPCWIVTPVEVGSRHL